jgi:hypothetical protein
MPVSFTLRASKIFAVTLIIISGRSPDSWAFVFGVDRSPHGFHFRIRGRKSKTHSDEDLEEENNVEDALHIDRSSELQFSCACCNDSFCRFGSALRRAEKADVFIASESPKTCGGKSVIKYLR